MEEFKACELLEHPTGTISSQGLLIIMSWIKKCIVVKDGIVFVTLRNTESNEERDVLLDEDNISLAEYITVHCGYIFACKPRRNIANMVLGVDTDTRKYIDHINGNTFDNRRVNLRVCTPSQNGRNRHRHSRSNTSIVGIAERSSGGYHYYRAQYTDLCGRRIVKQFNINRLGQDEALEAAKCWLNENRRANDYIVDSGSETSRKT